MSYKFQTLGDLLAKKGDFTEEELLDLKGIYGIIRTNTDYLLQIALKKDISVAEVYWETIRSRKLIDDKIGEKQAERAKTATRQEMP